MVMPALVFSMLMPNYAYMMYRTENKHPPPNGPRLPVEPRRHHKLVHGHREGPAGRHRKALHGHLRVSYIAETTERITGHS